MVLAISGREKEVIRNWSFRGNLMVNFLLPDTKKNYLLEIAEKERRRAFDLFFADYKSNWNHIFEDSKRRNKEIMALLESNLRRSLNILVELGWPPHGDIYIPEAKRIVQIYDEFGHERSKSIVNVFFLEKYSTPKILEILNQWDKKVWLKKRIPILRQVINSHVNGDFYVAIPALLSQLEGIIADGFGHFGWLGSKSLEKYYKNLLSERKKFSLDDQIQKYIFHYVLVHFEHGENPISPISRHAILHGGDTDYGTAANSLKSILLFDYIQDKFVFVSVGEGKSYHLISCPVVRKHRMRNKKGTWHIFQDKSNAESAGKSPCKLCKP